MLVVPRYTFDDILIEPCFSTIRSRQDVDLSQYFLDRIITLPVMNANMDTVASIEMCKALSTAGAIGTLHRFCSIEKNVQVYLDTCTQGTPSPIVSVGVGIAEEERAKALIKAGATRVLIDIAHAASSVMVETYTNLASQFSDVKFIVGNFGSADELTQFLVYVKPFKPDAVKVGIGGGSLCTTRIVTGCGVPTFSSVMECAAVAEDYNIKLIADGGIRSTGDIVKALAAGADVVMLGAMFAGTDETPGSVIKDTHGVFKEYRGSASLSSYITQEKVAKWRAPEGEATLVPYKGPVKNVLENINGGIRSACSYVGANDLAELRGKAKFIHVTSNAVIENGPHGKK